jgi:hypothetical protein
MERFDTFADRFWKKVEKTATCWIWLGATTVGYGRIKISKKAHLAHRVSYIMAYGYLEDHEYVLHRCDNRRCVRPSHLFKGSHSDNMKDAYAKGRLNFQVKPSLFQGTAKHNVKLTDSDVRHIRRLWVSGEMNKTELGRRFGVDRKNIRLILQGKRWKHI